MNRFYTDDKTKWIGRLSINPGRGPHSASSSIDHFIFDGPDGSPVAKLRHAYTAALESIDGIAAQRESVTATGKYLPLGITEAVAKHAVEDSLPKLRRARATLDKVKAEIAERRSALAPKPLSPETKEIRAELRARLSRMAPAERKALIDENRQDPELVGAIIEASPLVSGVDRTVFGHLRAEQIEREHGETIAELSDLTEVAGVAERVINLGRDQIREIVGVDHNTFEQLATVAERNGGNLPFKIDREVVDGQMTEVARVLDLETKTWRRATGSEIMASRSDAAAA